MGFQPNEAWKTTRKASRAQILFYVQGPLLILMSRPISVPLRKRRSNLTPFDVAICHRRVRLNLNDLSRVAFRRAARPRVAAIQPVHVASGIPPDAENENHTPRQGATHTLQAVEAVKRRRAGRDTELLSHAVSRLRALNVNRCVLDDLAILDVQTADLGEDAIGGWELGDDGEGARGVNDQPGAVVGVVAEGEVVVAAAVLVADAGGLTFISGAGIDAVDAAGVGGVGGGCVVSFPDVHFIAA